MKLPALATKESTEYSLEQEWEEFEDCNLTDPVDKPWIEVDASSQELLPEDQLAEFSPEQELLFQRRFEKCGLLDPFYQQ